MTGVICLAVWMLGIAVTCVIHVRDRSDEDWPIGAFVIGIMLWPMLVAFVIAVRIAALGMRGRGEDPEAVEAATRIRRRRS